MSPQNSNRSTIFAPANHVEVDHRYDRMQGSGPLDLLKFGGLYPAAFATKGFHLEVGALEAAGSLEQGYGFPQQGGALCSTVGVRSLLQRGGRLRSGEITPCIDPVPTSEEADLLTGKGNKDK